MNEETNIPLIRAAARGSLDHVLRAVQAGANINALDYNNHTALHIARSSKHVDLADELEKLGAIADLQVDECSTNTDPKCLSTRRENAVNFLMSSFPASVASKLMRNQHAASVCRPCVSIVFLDVAGYSQLRGACAPAVVCMLERLWGALDALAAEHGVERIDAFDGCYMAAANCSVPQPADHAARAARFAAVAVAATAAVPVDTGRPELGCVRLMGGMHCGAVCGSVVGAHGGHKHTLHGDAVNVASRMQSHGAAGAVQCLAAGAALIALQRRRADGDAAGGRRGGEGAGADADGLGVRGRGGGRVGREERSCLGRGCQFMWKGPWAKSFGADLLKSIA